MKYAFWFLLLFIPAAALAQDKPEHWCGNEAFSEAGPTFRMARVKNLPAGKVYFLQGTDNSAATNPSQLLKPTKSYLLPGDSVIVARTYQSWICSLFKSTVRNKVAHATVGWLPLDALEIQNTNPPAAFKSWLGLWRDGENTFAITPNPEQGSLKISGTATWKGPGDNVHEGSVAGVAKPEGDHWSLTNEDGCQVKATLVGSLLVVSDNRKCGGMYVSFNGVYHKTSEHDHLKPLHKNL